MDQPTYIQVSAAGDVTVVRFCEKRLFDQDAIDETGRQLSELVESGRTKKMLLNLAAVEFVSSAALGMLVHLDRKVQAAAGTMKLCGLQRDVEELLKLSRLHTIFEIRKNQADALRAF